MFSAVGAKKPKSESNNDEVTNLTVTVQDQDRTTPVATSSSNADQDAVLLEQQIVNKNLAVKQTVAVGNLEDSQDFDDILCPTQA